MKQGRFSGVARVRQHGCCFVLLIVATISAAVGPQAASIAWARGDAVESPYREGTSGRGELRFVDGVPLLVLRGTPEEMGRQEALLC
ncbi:MAG: hypothetical protein D6741_00245, partial [Planctomycetota bacterium]